MIVMEAQRGESSVAEICCNHSIAQSVFYTWNKEFMEAGKISLAGNTAREATRFSQRQKFSLSVNSPKMRQHLSASIDRNHL